MNYSTIAMHVYLLLIKMLSEVANVLSITQLLYYPILGTKLFEL